MKKEKEILTEADLVEMLAKRYAPPEWAFLSHVRNGTGYLKSVRTSDAIAMNLWPSRGLGIQGFEIKTYRGDWVKELKNPAKAEETAQFCDGWWLVVSDAEIVRNGELPETWGLLVAKGKRLYCEKECAPQKPIPIDKLFLAAILRKTQEAMNSTPNLQAQYKAGYKRGEEMTRTGMQSDLDRLTDKLQQMKELIEGFEKASGINLKDYHYSGNPEKLGQAFRIVTSKSDMDWKIKQIKTMRDSLTEILDGFEKVESGEIF